MSSMILNGDTSGAITVTVPAVAGTNTATLPAATGTVMVSGNMPAFSAYANTNQSIGASTFTKLQINSTATTGFDTNSNYSISNYRFTPTVAGYYQINGAVGYTANPGTYGIATIYKNNSEFLRGTQGSNTNCIVSGIIYFNGSTDYVELWAYASNASTASGVSYLTYFNGSMIRAA